MCYHVDSKEFCWIAWLCDCVVLCCVVLWCVVNCCVGLCGCCVGVDVWCVVLYCGGLFCCCIMLCWVVLSSRLL